MSLAWQPGETADILRMEELRIIKLPKGWFWGGGNPKDDYETRTDHTTRHGGKATGYMKSAVSQPQSFRTMMQSIKADDYRGKRVRLSGYVKGENIAKYAGLWLRVDGAGYSLNFDNMETDRLKARRIGKSMRSFWTCLKKVSPSRLGSLSKVRAKFG